VGCVMTLEFKKTFMDEWTGIPDPAHLDVLARAMTQTIEPLEAALAAMTPAASSQDSPDQLAS